MKLNSQFRVGVIAKFPSIGGVTVLVSRVALALQAAGFETELVFIRSSPPMPGASEWNGPKRAWLRNRWAQASTLVGMPLMRSVFRESYTPDHSPDPFSWFLAPAVDRWADKYDFVILGDETFGLFSQYLLRFSRIPFTVLVHEGSNPSPMFLQGPQRSMLRHAEFVVAMSPRIQSLLNGRVPGLATVCVTPTLPTQRPDLARTMAVLCDTRWTEGRDPSFLLDIMMIEKKATYILGGSFASSDLLRRFKDEAKERQLEGRLQFALNQSDTILNSLYATCGCAIRWSGTNGRLYETGVGLLTLHALENGCPIVVDENLGGSDLITNGDSGLVVRRSPLDFSRAISSILTDGLLAERLSKGASKLAWELSASTAGERLRQLIIASVQRRSMAASP
jgi:glycosyltransferase involved in cell wall biosynthesis